MSTLIKAGPQRWPSRGCWRSPAAETTTTTTSIVDRRRRRPRTPRRRAAGSARPLAVSLTEFALDPPDPTVKSGTVTFDVSNDGEIIHNLEVEGPNGESELTPDLDAGDCGTLEVDLRSPAPTSGTARSATTATQGMEGEITVE